MSDYYRDLMINRFNHDFSRDVYDGMNVLSTDYTVWTTKQGHSIKICDMSTQHIENTISMLKRANNGSYDHWIDVLTSEINNRKQII